MNDVPARRRRRGLRLLIGGACAAALAVTGTMLATNAHAEADRTITSNPTGTHNGFFFSYWKDSGNVTMTLGAGGSYSVQWNGINNSVVGKGWNPGSSHTVNYSGSLQLRRQLLPGPVRLDDQPAHRVLRRRELRQLQPEHRRPAAGLGHHRRQHLRHLPHPAGQPALHHRHRDVLPVLERPAAASAPAAPSPSPTTSTPGAARPEPRHARTTRSWPPRATRAAAAPTSPSAKAAGGGTQPPAPAASRRWRRRWPTAAAATSG